MPLSSRKIPLFVSLQRLLSDWSDATGNPTIRVEITVVSGARQQGVDGLVGPLSGARKIPNRRATPPVGLNLFVASSIAKMGMTELSIAVLPWLITLLVFLGLVTYIPETALAAARAGACFSNEFLRKLNAHT